MLCGGGQSPTEPHEYINIYSRYQEVQTHVYSSQWLQIFMNILGLSYQR